MLGVRVWKNMGEEAATEIGNDVSKEERGTKKRGKCHINPNLIMLKLTLFMFYGGMALFITKLNVRALKQIVFSYVFVGTIFNNSHAKHRTEHGANCIDILIATVHDFLSTTFNGLSRR